MTAPVDWRHIEAHLKLQSVLWHAMAEAAYRTPRPELAHLSRDFGGEVGFLYRRLAQTAESFADQAREIAYAEEHPACEDADELAGDTAATDRCRCGHSREEHQPSCRQNRITIGSTPPGFRPRTEPCRCLGFDFWRAAENAQAS